MKSREIQEALEAELRRHGRKGTVEAGGKHPRIVWREGERVRCLTFSASPSCCFARQKAVAVLRRMLRGRR